MSVIILTVMVFLVVTGLLLTAAYFLFAVPMARKQMRTRLATIGEGGGMTTIVDTGILHQDPLGSMPGLQKLMERIPFLPKLQLYIEQAGMTIPAGALILIALGVGLFPALVGALMFIPGPVALAASILFGIVPFLYLAVKRQSRFRKFSGIFPEAIDMLARAVRAGHAFTTGFSLIAEEMPDPVATEFRITYQQQNLGMSMPDALKLMCVRVPLPDVQIFVSALLIQRETGGNLAEILDNLSLVIRERFKLFRQMQILTTEGRLSMYTLMALPLLTAIAAYWANPNYMKLMLEDKIGHAMIIGAITMQVIGYLVIKRIIRMKV